MINSSSRRWLWRNDCAVTFAPYSRFSSMHSKLTSTGDLNITMSGKLHRKITSHQFRFGLPLRCHLFLYLSALGSACLLLLSFITHCFTVLLSTVVVNALNMMTDMPRVFTLSIYEGMNAIITVLQFHHLPVATCDRSVNLFSNEYVPFREPSGTLPHRLRSNDVWLYEMMNNADHYYITRSLHSLTPTDISHYYPLSRNTTSTR